MKIALLGNCQVQTLDMLTRAMLPSVETTVLDYSGAASRVEGDRVAYAASLGAADLIITQPAHLSHTSHEELVARYGSKVCVISNFYFRGLFPDSCYIGSFENRLTKPTAVHSAIILDAYQRGLSPAEAAQAFTLENYERLFLLDAWTSSVKEMRARDQSSRVTVPGSAMIEDACRRYPAFLTMNHPSIAFLSEYLCDVFDHLNLRYATLRPGQIEDPLAEHDFGPIDDVIAEHLNLRYRTSQKWCVHTLLTKYVSRAEMIERFYDSYDKVETQSLRINSPTDLVPRYAEDSGLACLVDGTWRRSTSHTMGRTAAYRQAVKEDQVGIDEKLAELNAVMHRVHSFTEVNDPKIERLVHALAERVDVANELALIRKELQRSTESEERGLSSIARDGVRSTTRRLYRVLSLRLNILLIIACAIVAYVSFRYLFKAG